MVKQNQEMSISNKAWKEYFQTFVAKSTKRRKAMKIFKNNKGYDSQRVSCITNVLPVLDDKQDFSLGE